MTYLLKHLAFYVGDTIDVGIEILPMKSLQKSMSSGVAYYEGELYNVVRQGRGCSCCTNCFSWCRTLTRRFFNFQSYLSLKLKLNHRGKMTRF